MSELKRGPSFKSWKIKYLLDVAGTGRTIQTRRPCKPMTEALSKAREWPAGMTGWYFHLWNDGRMEVSARLGDDDGEFLFAIDTPYPPGSYYVREGCYGEECDFCGHLVTRYSANNAMTWDSENEHIPWQCADGSPRKVSKVPGRYMRSKCARVRLDVTDVRVEAFGDISRDDAIAEGAEWHPNWSGEFGNCPDMFFNNIVIPGIYDDPADWWWAYEGTVSLIGEGQ